MKNLKKAVFSATLTFTLITYLATMFMNMMDNPTYAFTFGTMSRVLIFSVVLGVAGLIFEIKKLPAYAKRFIHFVILCINFTLVIATLPYGNDFRMLFAALLVFMIVYWIFVGIGALIKKIFKK